MMHTQGRPGEPPQAGEPLAGSYFVSTYPPFSTWTDQQVPQARRALDAGPAAPLDAPLGLYVHIPFCVKRCQFCYYLSYAGRSAADFERYTAALVKELRMLRATRALANRELSFVYFGGGTPSLLPARLIASLLAALQRIFPWTHVREATFECAPQTATEDRLRILRDAGVTRLSIGVQQLDDGVLKANGRVHLLRDIERAWTTARRIGFDVVNLDLIVGLVSETDDTFFASLERVIEMQPESVTVYQLEIPLNTPLYRALRADESSVAPPAWEVKRDRLARGFARLEEAGYTVRSAYAAVRDPQRHTFIYQDAQYRGADLLGIGAASFSYLAGVHHQNLTALDTYLDATDAGGMPIGRAHVLSDDERLIREFVLQLKLGAVESAYFQSKFGVTITERFAEPLRRLTERDWVRIDEHGVRLTRDGLLRVDRIIPEFYLPQHRGVRYS